MQSAQDLSGQVPAGRNSGRSSDEVDEIRRTLGNTTILALRQIYGAGFAPNIPGELKVGEVLGRLDRSSIALLAWKLHS